MDLTAADRQAKQSVGEPEDVATETGRTKSQEETVKNRQGLGALQGNSDQSDV